MKNLDRIRLIVAVAVGCGAIGLLLWSRGTGRQEETRESDIETMQQELISQAEEQQDTERAGAASVSVSGPAELEAPSSGTTAASAAVTAASGSVASGSASTGSTGGAKAVLAKPGAADISGNSLYRASAGKDYGYATDRTPATAETVLKEMRDYWDSTGLEALRDLWKLDRYTALSAWLAAHPDTPYFYLGDRDSAGLPEGKGVACYSANRYYYGEWKAGKRDGTGEWYQFYPEETQDVVALHEYTGSWRDDLPNGEGTDLYEYRRERMDDASHYPQNVIGSFTDGLYDGLMYVILTDRNGGIQEWYGTCEKGVWQVIDHPDADGKLPVLWSGVDASVRMTMLPSLASGYGVYHVR